MTKNNTLLYTFLKTCSFLCFFGFSLLGFAQTDTLKTNTDDDIDTQMEDVISNTASDGEVDYTIITDYLQDLKRKPLNLNSASREELLQLPGMNDILVNYLFKYLADFGELTSVFELQAIEGFTQQVVQNIQPFVTTDARPKDIDPNRLHPAGPSLREIKEGMKFDFTQRFIRTLESQAGYQINDVTKNRYLGNAWRSYSRLRGKYNQYVSFAITGDKDAGEVFGFNPTVEMPDDVTGSKKVKVKNYWGYDFLSGHIAVANFGNLKNLVIGDYNLQFGQGLIFSSGLGFGKNGADVIVPVKMPSKGIVPYSSVNENMYRRGIAATYAVKRLYFTGFYSRTKLDGSISSDSVDAETGALINSGEFASASSFQLGGYHRTPNELSKRQNVTESNMGGRVEYRGKTFRIGTSHLFQQFDRSFQPNPSYYNQFYFSGNQNYLNGLDFDWVIKNVNVFGEVARSKSGGMGISTGLMMALSPKVDFSLHYRNFSPDFHSDKAFVFAESPRNPRNEQGIYAGLRIKPTTKWTINTYFDRSHYAYNRFLTAYFSNAYEFLTQIDYSPKRGTTLYARFKTDNKERNADDSLYLPNQQIYFLTQTQNTHFRLQYQSQLAREVTIRTRAEWSWFRGRDQKTLRGFLIYQDISWKILPKLKATGRFAIFSTEGYDARIYAYENTIYGDFSIPAYGGSLDEDKDNRNGTRYYAMLTYQPLRGLDIWVRFSQTRYFSPNFAGSPTGSASLYLPVNTIGGSLDEILGNHRSDIKLQIRYSF
ncbi:MAG: ComEA family DNA-binding protein [Bacteroidia bacterium]